MKYRGLQLDAFQQRAIEGLAAGRSVLVSAPTGTGKTIIADWIVEEALETGRQVIYTAPIKALSNQKYRDYVRLYGEERVGLVTGDLVIRRDAPCLVMTTEILRNILLGDEGVDDLMAVILDEIHFLDDRDRGTVWEEVLIYLPSHVQIVGLSATLSNLHDFSSWLEDVRQGPVDVIVETERAVPLTFRYLATETGLRDPISYEKAWRQRRGGARGRRRRDDKKNGGRRGRHQRKTTHIEAFQALAEADLFPYLYFVFSRRDTEKLARALGRLTQRSLLDAEESERSAVRLSEARQQLGTTLDPELKALYARGIAFHHAGLHVQLKALVEELYEARLIKVLYCTSTFALGINMPARSVVFDGLRKYDGRGFAALTTRQFMQKAGRAGRRGMDDVGHVVIRMDLEEFSEAKPQLERYAKGTSEPVRSSFSLSWNSIVNLLERHDGDLTRLREVADKSFLSWHLDQSADRHEARAEELDAVARRSNKEVNRLRNRAEKARTRVASSLRERIDYLVDVGYLGVELTLQAGATVLGKLQITEVFMTELVLSGFLEPLSPAELFGVLCGVTGNLPRHAHSLFRPTGDERALARQIKQVRWSDVVVGADELAGTDETSWDPDIMHLGRRWAEGASLDSILDEINSETDISGDLISTFRRAKDLAGQLRDVYRHDEDRAASLKRLIREVSRDEVEVVG